MKSETNEARTVTVSFLIVSDEEGGLVQASDEEVECFGVLAESVRLTAKIIDTPCSEMNTDNFLDEVKIVGKHLGIEPYVVDGEKLKKQGFGGIYNVGKAACNTPKLVVLSHVRPEAKRTVAWVGKGIVFDTGGLCIKSRLAMCTMKHDCGGAAGVLGAFYAAVRLVSEAIPMIRRRLGTIRFPLNCLCLRVLGLRGQFARRFVSGRKCRRS